MKRILILGGGAAGIAAAIAAAEQAGSGAQVILLERNSRIGKKLLATGNGRCNLDNIHIGPDCYFTSDPAAMADMLDTIGRADPLGWFEDHGLLTRTDETGRVYPYSNQAADVLNLLLHWLERTGVQVETDCTVTGLTRRGGGWQAALSDGRSIKADGVICALGGSAGPQFGTDGFGTALAETLGCTCVPLYPCLVPLKCKKSQVNGLSGIRVKADASLFDSSRFLRRESGEIQFTDYGLSGIAVMQLSGLLAPNSGIRQPEISLDLFPQCSHSELTQLLRSHSRALPHADAGQFMTGLVHRRVGLAVWKAAGLGDEKRDTASLTPKDWQRLAQTFKNWRFTGLENTGWKNAQTTGGGISLSQLEPDSFQLKGKPGLYFVGETPDCAGACGGFNLHWAFGSGIIAGRHAALWVK